MSVVFGESQTLIGSLKGANFNVTTDQSIPMTAPKYIIRRITVTNASVSLTLAAGGFYTGAAKSGSILVAAAQIYTALTAASKYQDSTLAGVVGTDTRSEAALFFSLTTAQGAAATADIYIYGDVLP